MTNNTEIEIKLTSTDTKIWQNIFTLPFLAPYIIPGTNRTDKVEGYYFDTSEMLLAKQNIGYRIYKENDVFCATIKSVLSEQNGLSRRMEIELETDSFNPNIIGFGATELKKELTELVNNQPLETLFAINMVRRSFQLQITDNTIVEMAVDLGSVDSNSDTFPLAEVEFEIFSGSVPDLLEFVAKLTEILPLTIEPLSKYQKGLSLINKLHIAHHDTNAPNLGGKHVSFAQKLKNSTVSLVSKMVLPENNLENIINDVHSLVRYQNDLTDLTNHLQILSNVNGDNHNAENIKGLQKDLQRLILLHDIKIESDKMQKIVLAVDKKIALDNLLEPQILQAKQKIVARQNKGLITNILFEIWAELEKNKFLITNKLPIDLLNLQFSNLLKGLQAKDLLLEKVANRKIYLQLQILSCINKYFKEYYPEPAWQKVLQISENLCSAHQEMQLIIEQQHFSVNYIASNPQGLLAQTLSCYLGWQEHRFYLLTKSSLPAQEKFLKKIINIK